MDLRFTADEEGFRAEVRTFLSTALPTDVAEKVRLGKRLSRADMEGWHAALNRRGWLASHWPQQHGGAGWNVAQRYIFDVEAAIAHAPRIVPFGVSMLGPVLIEYGSPAQQRHWLPRILDGSDWWCQGFSEPGAGSDLASLRTTAVRDGDHYIVNGQKTWTTLGQHANMIFCLVRTSGDGRKQEGISFLLIDMATPGVELRPILLLNGEHEVNEVFFTDVRVPNGHLVGQENKGWSYAKYLLTYERTNIAGIGHSIAALDHLRHVARAQRKDGRSLAHDPLFCARVARVEIELENLRVTNLRALAAAGSNAAAGVESSMLKIRGTEVRQEITSLMRRALGPQAAAFLPDFLAGLTSETGLPDYAPAAAPSYFNNRKLSIFGGSNEIQREIIAKSVLAL